MKDPNTLHVFFIPREEREAFWRANKKIEYLQNSVVVTHERQLPVLFSKLSLDQKVILWIHIGTFQKDASGDPLNLNLAEDLKKNYFPNGQLLISLPPEGLNQIFEGI